MGTQAFYQEWTPAQVAYTVGESQVPAFRDPVTEIDKPYRYTYTASTTDVYGKKKPYQNIYHYSDSPLSKQELADEIYEEWEEGQGPGGRLGGSLRLELFRVTITGGAVLTDFSGVRPPW